MARKTSKIDNNEEKCVQDLPRKQGLSYSAIAILAMFILPGLIAVIMQVNDIIYPEAKADRIIRERVISCYEAANPNKLTEVDKILIKYKGKENILFAQLRNKYPKVHQCQ